MSTYQHSPNSDFRNEGWTLAGSGVTQVYQAWSSVGDDTKYCSNPANKGRAACKFPVDISSVSIPDGSAIESITIFLRGKKTDSGSRSVTVNVLCTDDTSHFTQRTVYLGDDITTQEIATYTKDPLGKPWTKDRIDRLILQVFSYCGAADRVRVYSCYVQINYRAKPVVKVTAPSGTVTSAAPAIGWTYTQTDGDPQKFAEYKIYTAAQQEAVGFNPDTTPALYPTSSTYTVKSGDSLFKIAAAKLGDGNLWPEIYAASTLRSGDPNLIFPGEVVTIPGVASITGDITSLTALPFALAQNDYYIYVRATSSRGARSDWANRTFTVAAGSGNPGIPGGSLGGAGTGGGGGFDSVIADGETSNVFITLRDGSNLLGAMQADFETLTDSLSWTGSNCTVAQDTTTNFGVGGASMKMTASSAADMTAYSSYARIAPSAPITARAQTLAIATGRTVTISVYFYDSVFNLLSGTISASGVDVTTTWTEVVATGTTPASTDAMYFRVGITVTGPANAEVHNVDHVGVMYGTNSAWSNGGHSGRNLLTSAQSTADDPITTEPWAGTSTATTYSRVSTTGTGSEGAKAFKMLYSGLSPSITFVATGTAFTDTTTGTGYTLNKPAGVVDGDVLVAYVASNTGGAATAPTGWTQLDYVTTSTSSLTVLIRDGLTADPSSWAGNLATSCTRKRAVVVAYRGAAATALQFSQENVGSSTGGSSLVQTATLTNSDPGAWRLSAFAVCDDAASGSLTANITPPSTPAGISYVGKAATWKSSASTTTFTINRPSGVASGDLMIASVAVSSETTINTPSGWTLVRQTQDTVQNSTHAVFKRTAGSSESSSWSATVDSNSHTSLITQAVAYRNCDLAANQFIAENGGTAESGSVTTPAITNTNSSAWRVSIFSYQTDGGTSTSSNEASERCDDTTTTGLSYGSEGHDMSLAIYDSNAKVSSGSQARSAQATSYRDVYSAHSWIGLLKPVTGGTTPGANETERQDATAGASNPWITLGVYDSNGVAATTATAVYGSFTPGSGTTITSSCSWLGFLVPASPTVSGEVAVTLSSYVDISAVSSDVTSRAGNQMSVAASFLGSTAGTPHVKLFSYVGNELVSTQVVQGSSFNTTTWTPSTANFVLPQGTTRVKLGFTTADRVASDYVLFDQVLLAYGADAVWRPGTGNAAHPVFNVPAIQYAQDLGDGYSDWADLPFTANALLKYDNLTGLCTFVDQSIVPLSNRKYRAKTVSYGLAGDIFTSDYGPESDEVTLVADEWWLKDMANPDGSMQLKLYNSGEGGAGGGAGTITVGTTDTSAVFQPLGADRPIVITEGYKGDTITLIIQVRNTAYTQLRNLLNARRTLYLQSNIDQSWWVRPNGDISATTQPTGDMHSNPLKFVTVTFVEVDSEA